MITLAIFTYRRIDQLNKCLETIDSKHVNEILIFNDDELKELSIDHLKINNPCIKIFNPSYWGFNDRKFRKPFYLNRAIEIAKNDKILFSDDDGEFAPNTINSHLIVLDKYEFSAGGVVRSKIFNKISNSILQGTNYAFKKSFFKKIGGYDEEFCNSMGGGDIDFWLRIYNFSKANKKECAFLPKAIQTVSGKSSRIKINRQFDPKDYTLKKHNLTIRGPMYKWFPEIREKKKWMTTIK